MRKSNRFVAVILVLITILVAGCGPRGTPTPGVDDVIASPQGLPIDEFFEQSFHQLRLRDPDTLIVDGLADAYGVDKAHFTNISDAYIRQTQQLESAILDQLHAYDRDTLSPGQQLSYDIYEWYLQDRVSGHEFVYYNYPVNSNEITSADFALFDFLVTYFPIASEEDAQDYLTRLSEVDTWMAQLLEGLKLRQEAGIIPPKFLLERSIAQIGDLILMEAPAARRAVNNDLYTSFAEKLDQVEGIDAEKREALLLDAKNQIEQIVIPAFVELREYLISLLPLAGDVPDLGRLPNGDAYYAYTLRQNTSTDLSADEIHELGKAEVARIQAEMRQVAHEGLGYPEDIDMRDLMGRLSMQSEDLQGEALVAEFERRIDEVRQVSGTYFNIFPTADVVVAYAPYAATNYYSGPAFDGSRPGTFFTPGRASGYVAPSILYHETIPGHHVTLALTLELELPTFRKSANNFFYAYTEGWALYAEWLAWEMGFYENDPMGNLGRLQLELLRAVRLVIDTGLNSREWTWSQAAAYMNSALGSNDPPDVLVRYVTMPGQGCSYTIGYLKIMELRQRAMDRLGDRFDIREFHDVVLGNGAMPLEILEQVVDDYIVEKQE